MGLADRQARLEGTARTYKPPRPVGPTQGLESRIKRLALAGVLSG